jgi:DNA polymerase-3 subunit gamma/tau
LYREYRPETFSAVIGQDHITTILKNQVREGKLSHAYLFCGSRGTGKTTSAKILSRAVNCLDPKDGEPCGTCAACRLAAAGSADVIEIDAASNNGVDDVRSLIEQAQFAPLELRYRVFIIDEVHMLSTAAFNALLKTLEEPPAHVLFILATTEPQKLPATIVSRCQRFDFHRLTIAHIVANLESVLKKAGAKIEPNGLRLIARAADGGMRDALSLADQCLSYAGNDVSEQDVLDALGSVSSAVLENTASALLAGNAADAIRALNDVVKNGRDLGVFLGDLAKHFRALLLAKTCGECADLLDCTDDQMQRYLKTAKGADEARILYASEQILLTQSRLRLFPSPRIPIEAAFVRICRPVDDTSFAALEARVARIEQRPAETVPETASAGSGVPVAPPEPGKPVVSVPVETPPWEDPAPEKQPAAKPAEPVAGPEPAPAEPPAANGEAETVWAQVKQKIMEINPMVYMYAKDTRGVGLSDGVLTVEFPATQESKLNGVKNARNLVVVKTALSRVRPDTEIAFRLAALANENEEKLKELFGSSLTIN